MKSIFRILLFAMAMTAFCASAYAQKDSRQRMTREQLAETQAKYIAQEMAMDGTTSEKFVETFCRFQKEIWALGPRPKREVSGRTDAETEQAIKERFAHSQKILDLRHKYYEEYSKFLSQQQIVRVYELEKKMMDRLYHRSQKAKTQKR
ncbi:MULTISPECIES: hypothetical protein [Bacteroides]|uniref:hypothetical protein n=1 Tax=Bacteroides TaxID=816 RepID=UPI000E43FDA0|nr:MULTISPECIES: hypothetical protein [Bacteroides]MBS7575003.1 hypothetical protein [Bacteroides propionicigenes]RGM29882.1 hypothetical protein DXC20_02940 [Bacteroides sp. OM08-17BH]HBO05108.1 hypothetical protein [Bacteroides sp.]